jgi:hypothetical protein
MRGVRARLAARRQLGSAAHIVSHLPDGSPVVMVDGRELIHRHHQGGSYFRLRVLCASCGRNHITWRGARITTASELARANPGELLCDPCIQARFMDDIEDAGDITDVFQELFDPEV